MANSPESHIDRHERRARETREDILRVFAETGRKAPADADLELASNTVASYPKAWRQADISPNSAWSVLFNYAEALDEIAARQRAA